MLVRLQSGLIDEILNGEQITGDMRTLDRRAMLVYCGDFESMDGPVSITEEHLQRLCDNHNNFLSKLSRLANGDVPIKHCPPIQLDHSTSAKDTIGRLKGELEIGEHTLADGCHVKALFGNVRILGEENVAKVMDGRWTHLSIGADLDAGKISELTVTPFPAAPEASMLSRLSGKVVKSGTIKGIRVQIVQDNLSKKFLALYNGAYDVGEWDSPEKAWEAIKEKIEIYSEDELSKMSKLAKDRFNETLHRGDKVEVREEFNDLEQGAEGVVMDAPEGSNFVTIKVGGKQYHVHGSDVAKLSLKEKWKKLSEGEESPMDKEKLKKYLKECKKMSDEEVEKHLSKLEGDEAEMKKLSCEMEEHEKKMSSEATEAEEKAKEEKLKAARENLTKLSTDFRKNQEGAKLAAKKGQILTRLSAIRAAARISPAEIKKLDLDKLAKLDAEALETLMSTYEAREPVIIPGMIGNANAEELSKLSKAKRMSELEMESRKNMGLLQHTVKDVKMEGNIVPGLVPEPVQQTVPVSMGGQPDQATALQMLMQLLEGGKIQEAMAALKQLIGSIAASNAPAPAAPAPAAAAPAATEEHEKQLSALAENVSQMQTQFEELLKLANSLVGEEKK